MTTLKTLFSTTKKITKAHYPFLFFFSGLIYLFKFIPTILTSDSQAGTTVQTHSFLQLLFMVIFLLVSSVLSTALLLTIPDCIDRKPLNFVQKIESAIRIYPKVLLLGILLVIASFILTIIPGFSAISLLIKSPNLANALLQDPSSLGVLFISMIPMLVFALFSSLSICILIFENLGVFASIKQSMKRVFKHFFKFLGWVVIGLLIWCLITGLITAFINFCLSHAALAFGYQYSMIFKNFFHYSVGAAFAPFFYVYGVLIYQATRPKAS